MPNNFPASRTLEDAFSDLRRRRDSLPASHPDLARLARTMTLLAAEITERHRDSAAVNLERLR
jgi:hypothetical protein